MIDRVVLAALTALLVLGCDDAGGVEAVGDVAPTGDVAPADGAADGLPPGADGAAPDGGAPADGGAAADGAIAEDAAPDGAASDGATLDATLDGSSPDAAPSPDARADAAPPDAGAVDGSRPTPDQGADARIADLGQPEDGPLCADECAAGAVRCDEGGVARCADEDDDPCREWTPPEPCAADEVCLAGECLPGVAPAVLINEVFYDADGGDAPSVFVELWGPPGTPVDGLALVGVNGNGGADYAEVRLVGAIGASGYYLVAHEDAGPALAAAADLRDAGADFQNGPDSIQLRWGADVVDAVGYGDFADAVFAGEGRPAADVPAGVSLSRDDAHTDTDDNSVDFVAGAPSPGGPGLDAIPDVGVEPDAQVRDAQVEDAGVADVELPDAALPRDAAPLPDADPFDERAILIVRPPAGETVPDHAPDDLGETTYGGAFALRYDNDRYFVFSATFGDRALEQVAEARLGEFVRLPPDTYAVVLNDTFVLLELDWNDRVEIGAGRLEAVSAQPGTYTVQPEERFDHFARPLPLRGCGPFGNQDRTRTLFGGCDGEVGGGAFDLSTGLNVLPANYRVAVTARFHSPNQAFVGVADGETTVYEPADIRGTIDVAPPAPGDLPDWAPDPGQGSFGGVGPPLRYGADRFYVLRYLNVVEGFEYLGSSQMGRPLAVPAGRFHVVLNDTYIIEDVVAGQRLVVPAGRAEVPGVGGYDLRPDEEHRRFRYLIDMGNCSRDGPEGNIFASCSNPRPGAITRGAGINVMPGTYELSVYDENDALLSTRPLRVE